MFTDDALDPNALQQILQARSQTLAQSSHAIDSVQGTGFVVLQVGK